MKKILILLSLLLTLSAIADIGGVGARPDKIMIPFDSPSDELEPLYHWYNTIDFLHASSCSMVYVTVCVDDEMGRPVRGLNLDNFTFIEEGDTVYPPNLRQLNECPVDTVAVDMVMFFDLSTSMDEEISELADHISEFIDALGPEIDFRLAFWTYNGCHGETIAPYVGVRELFRTDLGTPDCEYDEDATDIWATTSDEATCIFNAGYEYFYSLSATYRGSGYEDQYGMMAEACTTMAFREDARKVFMLFTDEEPVYRAEYCSPSWGPGEGPGSELYDYISFMQDHDIEVYCITPETGDFEYMAGREDEARAWYDGYGELCDSTGGHWFWLYTEDYGEMVDSIAGAISLEPCCYDFMYHTVNPCINPLHLDVHSYDDPWEGLTDTVYNGMCPPVFDLVIPSFSGGITTCDYQTIQYDLINPEFGLLDIETVSFWINGDMYVSDSPELDVTEDQVTFTPSVPFEHGDTVEFMVATAMNTGGCYDMTPTSTFIVDLLPPTCFDPFPVEGETLLVTPDSLAISITDDFSGVNWDDVSIDNFTITVAGDTLTPSGFDITDGRIVFTELGIDGQGEIVISVSDIPDSPDFDYCPPNLGDCMSSFLLVLEPEYVFFPDTIYPPCETLLIPIILDSLGPTPVSEASFLCSYDPEVIVPIGIVLDGSLMEDWIIGDTHLDTDAATISVSISGPELTEGVNGHLLYVRAYVPCAAWGGDYCPLHIDEAVFNTSFPRVITGDGFFVVDWRWTTWFTELRLNSTTNIGADLVLAIGGDEYSTDMYDATSDLIILPHVPGTVHGHLVNDDPDYFWITQLRRDMKDLTPPNRWIIPTSEEHNGIIKWQPSTLPEGKFYMNHTIDMKLDSLAYYGINDTLIIDWITPPLGIDTTCLFTGWNLVSLPAMPPRYPSEEVFPFSPVGVYRYTPSIRTYQETDRMEKGEGYWVYSPVDTCMKFGGVLISDYNRLVYPGWNMLGGLAEPVEVGDLCTDPPGAILGGSIYSYNAETGGYESADVLIPGKGYWFMILEEGVISVPSTGVFCRPYSYPASSAISATAEIDGEMLSFGLSSAAGSGIDAMDIPVPPAAPGADVRKAGFIRDGIYLVKDISSDAEWMLRCNSSTEISFGIIPDEMKPLHLTSPDGKEITVDDNAILTLEPGTWTLRKVGTKPEDMFILAAWPNPFNASLNIEYRIEGASVLRIFDSNGREVNSVEIDGHGSYIWNGNNASGTTLPSGVYNAVIDGHEGQAQRVILLK